MLTNSTKPVYVMHPLIQGAYQRVHDWFETQPDMKGYKNFTYKSDAGRVLKRENLVDAAFNFNHYFPTHYFKACHSTQAEQAVGLEKLASWLRYNPYLTVIDVGCGDGAGSVAVIDALLKLRQEDQLDTRRIQVHCVAVDPNPNGLVIYKKMLNEVAQSVVNLGIDIVTDLVKSTVSEASGATENYLFKMRHQWKQPSLSHAIFIMSNLTDILYARHNEETVSLNNYDRFGVSLKERFGEPVSAFIRHLFGEVPIDHLHLLSIDTEPEKIQLAVSQMVDDLKIRMDEKGHLFKHSNIQLETIKFQNPEPAYWRKRGYIEKEIDPFVVFAGHIDNQDLTTDERWKKIIASENLELAWARARQEMLRESFVDEIEIRLFEQDLSANLKRLGLELENYAVRFGYVNQILNYGFPKNTEVDRPRGLTWLEEEILMVAIIQVIGLNQLKISPHSYAYRLSPENLPERGSTEFLYERWSTAWKQYREDIETYAKKHMSGSAIKIDIQSYFTRILHDRLRKMLKEELQISRRIEWLLELLVSKEIKNHETGRGLVQGSIGSGFLSNLYLTPFDNLFSNNDAKKRQLFRYVDDIVVVVPDSEDAAPTKEILDSILDDLSLEANPDKTKTYSIPDLLVFYESDETLDSLYERYEDLVDSLWWLNDPVRADFREASSNQPLWWAKIETYRMCLAELGFYLSASSLSREISRKITNNTPSKLTLAFPNLPDDASMSAAQDWAKQFREQNTAWITEILSLRTDLVNLFQVSLKTLEEDKDIAQQKKDMANRRLRFAANRISILGFGEIHAQLTKIFCEAPWYIRDHVRLLENLGRQGYTEELWKIISHHISHLERDMSVYMCAITIRALRFVPRLEVDAWERLIDLMFVQEEIIKLMSSETWLFLTAKMDAAPFASKTLESLKTVFSDTGRLSRRLLKNYILILGKLNASGLEDVVSTKIDEIKMDALLSQAFKWAKQGLTHSTVLSTEPEIIRQKYYSTKYRHFDSGNDGYV